MLKNWKKNHTVLFSGHKNNVVYWIWFFCCTQGKCLFFSPCTLFSKSFSLTEAAATGAHPDTQNSFCFSGALPNLALLGAEKWLVHWLPLISPEWKANLLFQQHGTTPTSQLLVFWYFFWGLIIIICTHLSYFTKNVDILVSDLLCFPIITWILKQTQAMDWWHTTSGLGVKVLDLKDHMAERIGLVGAHYLFRAIQRFTPYEELFCC